jgi:hypothetical protein
MPAGSQGRWTEGSSRKKHRRQGSAELELESCAARAWTIDQPPPDPV